MKLSTLLTATALFAGIAGTASANSWTQAADYNTAVMISQLDQHFGSGCMAGDPYSCQTQQGLYNDAQNIEYAAYSCLAESNQNACYQFQAGAANINQLYMMAQQQTAAPAYGGYAGGYDSSYAGHEARMDQIRAAGAASTQHFNTVSDAMDASHERFMSTIND